MPIRSEIRSSAASALLLCFLAAGLVCSPQVASAESPLTRAESKLAVIDLRRALADTEDGLRMKSRLQELLDTRQGEYEAKEKEYVKSKEELERLAKEGKTSEPELRKKYALVEKQAYDLQNQGTVLRREMTQRENDMMLPILDKLNRLVRQVASREGYDVVVSRDAVPYFRGDLEITDRVIQLYNTANPAPADEKKPVKKDAKPPGSTAPAPGSTAPAPGSTAPAPRSTAPAPGSTAPKK